MLRKRGICEGVRVGKRDGSCGGNGGAVDGKGYDIRNRVAKDYNLYDTGGVGVCGKRNVL